MELPAAIIDIGTSTTKYGWSGSTHPMVVKTADAYEKIANSVYYREDLTKTGLYEGMRTSIPIQQEADFNPHAVENVLRYLLQDKMYVGDVGKHLTMFIDKPQTSLRDRARNAEMLFETTNSEAVYFASSAPMSLFSEGVTTGVVLECGHSRGFAVPVFEGYSMPLAIRSTNLCGHSVDVFLHDMLRDTLSLKLTESDASYIKEHLGFVAYDYEEARMTSMYRQKFSSFALPDGRKIRLGVEPFVSSEVLFQPGLHDTTEKLGLSALIHSSVVKCEPFLRARLYTHLVLSGGTTLFKGFPERLKKEIAHLAPASVDVQTHAVPRRQFAAWLGASVVSSSLEFDDVWISKELYTEVGPSIIPVRCFM